MIEGWLSVTVRAGRYRITIPKAVLEHNLGRIGGQTGAQIDNVFRFCIDRLIQSRPGIKEQLSYQISFNMPTEREVERNLWFR